MARTPWIVAVLLVGCGTDPMQMMQPMPQDTELAGDWFLCDTAACSTLRNIGAHWDPDGTWVMLEARSSQSLGPTDHYCSSPFDANRGIYTFDEPTGALVMTDDLGRDAGASTITFAEPVAELAQRGTVSMYTRIDPPRGDGTCPIN
jgi:hypothetical protein